MKKLFFFILVLCFPGLGFSQAIQYSATVPHVDGGPSGAPTTYGSWLRYDKTNKVLYRWTGASWDAISGAGSGGIYDGSGYVPAWTVAALQGNFRMHNSNLHEIMIGDTSVTGNVLSVNPYGAYLGSPSYFIRAYNEDLHTDFVSPAASLEFGATGADIRIESAASAFGFTVTDQRTTKKGIEYSGDYSAGFTDRSLVDKGYVDGVAGSGGGHTIRADDSDMTDRANLNFVSTSEITLLGADDSGNDETEISLTIAAGAVGTDDLAAGAVTTTEITNSSVTYAKVQDVSATDRLLGRDAPGAGVIEELIVGGGLEFTGSGGIRSSAFTGDVTKSVGGTVLTISTGAVGTDEIAAGAVTYSKLASTLTLTSDFTIDNDDTHAVIIGSSGSGPYLEVSPVSSHLGDNSYNLLVSREDNYARVLSPAGYLEMGEDYGSLYLTGDMTSGFDITDGRSTTEGLTYSADYSADFTDRSLVDKAYVDNIGPHYVLKTADETVNSSTTFQDDDALTFTCPANDKCVFTVRLFLDGVHDAQVKFKITAPSATTLRAYGMGGSSDDARAINQDNGFVDMRTYDTSGATHDDGCFEISGFVDSGASARTVTLQWAQVTSTAEDTKVLSGSWIEYKVID